MTVRDDGRSFSGLVALVTGAAGAGIGQATARALAARGATVIVTDIHAERTRKVTDAIAADHPDVTVVGHQMDAGSREDIDRVTATVADEVGPIRVLINNAAVNVLGSVFDYPVQAWDRIMDVNINGPWYLSRAVMPMMRDAGGGAIVNVSSYAADIGGAGIETPYAVSKGALNTLSRALAHEGGPFGIRVNTVSLGIVRGTKFVDDHPELLERADSRGPLGTLPHSTEVAESIVHLASGACAHVTGEILNIAAGAYMRN